MKIRGNTIGTPIKPEQNIIKATNLTEVEKEQARLNIGVDLNNYYDKEFLDPIIEDADRRLSAIEDNFYDGSYTDIEDNPLPIEVTTEAEMNALLDTAEVGSVYKYAEDAEDSGTYEKGALYIVEAVEE